MESSSNQQKKKKVEDMYLNFIKLLHDSNDSLNKTKGANKQLKDLRSNLLNALSSCIENAEKETTNSMHEIAWDRLVIAFFGETNAGKSTIIETFRILFDKKRLPHNDGLIVGDGRQDFTIDYHEYDLSINGKPFTLIDVPGIEGNETDFKDIIKGALQKAHCVFYVHGHNKKPDTATAKKIKDYLGEWVNVYTIQNIRADASYYDEEELRQTLFTSGINKGSELITNAFKEILGDVYKGNIPLQALLAMCAKADFTPKRPDLIKTQQKLYRFFGDAEAILRFSQFQTLINVVEQKATNFTDEIMDANRQKVIALANTVVRMLQKITNNHKDKCNLLKNQLRDFKRDVNDMFAVANYSLTYGIKPFVDSEFSQLKNTLYSIIDKNGTNVKEEACMAVKRFEYSFSTNLKSMVSRQLDTLNQTYQRKKKKLEGVHLLYMEMRRVDVSFDLDITNDLKELDINLDDVGDVLGATASGAAVGFAVGSFVPVIGNIVGASVGAGVGFLGSIFSKGASNNKTSSTKNEISKTLDEAKTKVSSAVSNSLNPLLIELSNKKQQLLKDIETELKNLSELNSIADQLLIDVDSYIQNIKTK